MDGSLFLVSRQNTSLARRCRKGAIHPIIRSPPRRATKGFEERQAERLWTVFSSVSLAQRARQVFGGDLNCSELVPLAAELTVVAPRKLLLGPNYIAWNRRLCGRRAVPTEISALSAFAAAGAAIFAIAPRSASPRWPAARAARSTSAQVCERRDATSLWAP